MIVTLVCDVLGEENNGTTIAANNLARSLREKGHTVRIVCPDQDKEGLPDYYIVPVINVGPINPILRKNDVVVSKPDRELLEKAMDGADIVHVMLPFPQGIKASKVAKELGLPLSVGYHFLSENITAHLYLEKAQHLNKQIFKIFDNFYARADAIHFPTQFLRDAYEKDHGPSNGYVISNGVVSEIYPKETEKPEKYKDKFIIMYSGRLSREKSHFLLVDAVMKSAHEKDIQLIFAGDGPRKKQIYKRAKNLTNPLEINFFSRSEMEDLLNYSDLYVHAAEAEAEGIACLEAIVCGLVPVISDSPRSATNAYAIDEKSLFKWNSPEDLAAKIDWWIEHPEERAEYSRRYKDKFKNEFDHDHCMDLMEQMLLETAGLKEKSN